MKKVYRPRIALLPCAIALALLGHDTGLASTSIRGSIAGRVFDSETRQLVPDVTVGVAIVTGGESFQAVTDGKGAYHLAGAPAAVYSFTLQAGGVDFPVRERMDLRVSMPFILESCFELDRKAKAARVRMDCESGFVEQARVATIGPHRFLLPENFQETQPASGNLPSKPTSIQHEVIQCLAREYFPQVDAAIPPGAQVQSSRVYFRSDKYPDFYWVEMTKQHPTIDDFQALIPKPGPETERIIYYLESVDLEFDNLQTPEFAPEVIEADECRKRGTPAWYAGEAPPGIVVGATVPGASAIPAGFSAAGIVGFVNSLGVLSAVGGAAAAGGVFGSTAAILVIGGGTAAVVTGFMILGGDEASPPN